MLNLMFCHVLDVSFDVPLRNFKTPEGGWQTLKSFTVPTRWLQIFAVITACWQMKMEELTVNGMKAGMVLDFFVGMLVALKTYGGFATSPDHVDSLKLW
eukprot:g40616.t1